MTHGLELCILYPTSRILYTPIAELEIYCALCVVYDRLMPPESILTRAEKPQSLDEQAYEQIKEAVISCSVNPGEFVAEVWMAEEMGISKTPIRKAMARLHQEGFLDNVPYRGYYVAEISVQDIAEIYELRELLECHLVRETVPHFSPAEFDQIERLVDEADAAFAADNFRDFVELNREFHRAFLHKHRSHRIRDVLRNLEEHVRRIIMYVLKKGYTDLLELQRDDHRMILQAARDGDVPRAEELTQAHLRTFSKALIARQTSLEATVNTD